MATNDYTEGSTHTVLHTQLYTVLIQIKKVKLLVITAVNELLQILLVDFHQHQI